MGGMRSRRDRGRIFRRLRVRIWSSDGVDHARTRIDVGIARECLTFRNRIRGLAGLEPLGNDDSVFLKHARRFFGDPASRVVPAGSDEFLG